MSTGPKVLTEGIDSMEGVDIIKRVVKKADTVEANHCRENSLR